MISQMHDWCGVAGGLFYVAPGPTSGFDLEPSVGKVFVWLLCWRVRILWAEELENIKTFPCPRDPSTSSEGIWTLLAPT